MPVQATDDGIYDTCNEKDKFYVIKVPGIPAERVQKYFQPHYGAGAEIEAPVIARRRWVLRGADLPAAARQKFQQQGFVTIKAGAYNGPYDYTWPQVRGFFRDNLLNVDETGEL